MQQPALLLCSLCAWAHEGRDEPEAPASAAAGHSLGEYAALVAAGRAGLRGRRAAVAERGAAMADAGRRRPAAMLALLGGEDARRARPGRAPSA